ncbi:hypothetical protein [Paraburkholderia sp. BL25I1N1]|nr:hypothetical protein [Paraburkholderia sp. BL25I1N1]PRY03807.1 hypothetical protein B0G73_114128 [Paraburkholderia sp. BL25I1N1]
MKSYWQIRDAEGRILADHLSWPIVTEVLATFQHHNLIVTLHQMQTEG